MKIAILGDTHHGMRSDSVIFHNHYREFYSKTFFPYLEKHNITTVIQLGDLFDRRKYISFQTLALCRKYFFDKLRDKEIQFYTLLGNHDIAFRNTLEVNSPQLLLKEYPNITVFDKPTSFEEIDIIPWICKDNEQEIMQFIKDSTNEVCMGHFELSGFEMDRGNICHEGMDPKILSRYDMVFSGHFHHKSTKGNITYVGTPGEMTWSDYNDERGFHIFDTKTRELEFVDNPIKIFYKVKYNDSQESFNELSNTNYDHLLNKYVKVVIENRCNPILFDALVEKITSAHPAELSIVEDYSDILKEAENIEIDEAQDTVTILNKYVDGLTLGEDSSKIKSILREVYTEALSLERL
jgi:DNA repair exonuclease SbcCD nuclease subunit